MNFIPLLVAIIALLIELVLKQIMANYDDAICEGIKGCIRSLYYFQS